MGRKGRIIVSIVGIFIILLTLMFLTYGYYLANIKGNVNSKSITISNTKLELEYADVNENLITDTESYPGKSWTKTFSVTSKGKYKEIITYGVSLENVVNPFERNNDLVYTLECEEYLKNGFTIDKENKSVSGTLSGRTCKGVEEEVVFPIFGKILVENDIEEDYVHVYSLNIIYKEMNENQSVDMGKIFSAKVNIVDPKTYFNLSNIVYNSALGGSGDRTVYKDIPNTVPAEEPSNSNERVLSRAEDDYGISYYFRGNVYDNYVKFAGLTWRIVRINGDGTVKLILNDVLHDSSGNTKNGNFGYTKFDINALTATDGTKNTTEKYLINYLNGRTYNTSSMAYIFEDFQSSLSSIIKSNNSNKTLDDYLKVGDWCINDKAFSKKDDNSTPLTNEEILDKLIKGIEFYYDSRVRLSGKEIKEPTFKCNGTNMDKFADNTDMYVGTLTADEIVYAGDKIFNLYSYSYNYLSMGSAGNATPNWWTLSPNFLSSGSDVMSVFIVNNSGVLSSYYANDNNIAFRPAINLKSDIQISSGNGTSNNPYVIIM